MEEKKSKKHITLVAFKFLQLGNENNFYTFSFDSNSTTLEHFKKEIFSFFLNKLSEINYHINEAIFLDDPTKENIIYNDSLDNKNKGKKLLTYFTDIDKEICFYFLVKNSKLHFYKNKVLCYEEIPKECDSNYQELRKKVEEGQHFNIILQTYNSSFTQIEVCPEMTVGELKDKIEDRLKISKNYQELLYIIYKLDDNNKNLKDYCVRPNGIIFLRGHYFPLIFADFFKKSNRKILGINIAEQINEIKQKIIKKLELEFDDFKLICNGKELEEDKYLIQYNIQKLQLIYYK